MSPMLKMKIDLFTLKIGVSVLVLAAKLIAIADWNTQRVLNAKR